MLSYFSWSVKYIIKSYGIASSHDDMMRQGLAFKTRTFLSLASKKVFEKIYEILFCIESKLSASSSVAAMPGTNPMRESLSLKSKISPKLCSTVYYLNLDQNNIRVYSKLR